MNLLIDCELSAVCERAAVPAAFALLGVLALGV